MNCIIISSPLINEETGTETLHNQSKVAELSSGEARTKIEALWENLSTQLPRYQHFSGQGWARYLEPVSSVILCTPKSEVHWLQWEGPEFSGPPMASAGLPSWMFEFSHQSLGPLTVPRVVIHQARGGGMNAECKTRNPSDSCSQCWKAWLE